jgi:hypothetical protein
VQNCLATKDDAIALAKRLQEKLPKLAEAYPKTETGRTEYTKAIWKFFSEECTNYDPEWTLYPKAEPQKGKVFGEFLNDFSLFDERWGCRIACESEWGDIDRVYWGFDKLRAVKADIKILIFQYQNLGDCLPYPVEQKFKQELANSGHHHPGHDFYLFVQFDREKSKIFLWEPRESGPFLPDQIDIESLNG